MLRAIPDEIVIDSRSRRGADARARSAAAARRARASAPGRDPRRGDDRPAPIRATRASLAGRRLDRPADPGAQHLRSRRALRRGQVRPLDQAVGAARRRLAGELVAGRRARLIRRGTSCSPTHRRATQSTAPRSQDGSRACGTRGARHHVSRSAPHVRHAAGRLRGTASHDPGVPRPRRQQDDTDLLPLRPVGARSPAGQRGLRPKPAGKAERDPPASDPRVEASAGGDPEAGSGKRTYGVQYGEQIERKREQLSGDKPSRMGSKDAATLDPSGWGPGGRRFKSCLPDTRSQVQIL